jgi:3-methyladenine DNA glycosylase AlkD
MNLDEAMQALESVGSEQTRKTYIRHGVTGEQFGVLTSDMKALQKKIKRDHALAVQLWETRNHDARVLASMIIDPAQITEEQADRWVLDLRNYVETEYFTKMIAPAPFALAKAEAWMRADHEWIEYAGWGLLGHIASADTTLPDSFFQPYLDWIERDIHTAKNRVRHAMNYVVINLGTRSETLREPTEALARRIGTVQVDHGQTNCTTPDALSYMERIRAHREKKKT